MTREERNQWLINIDSAASYIASEIGKETVDFVLEKFGVTSIEEIASSELSEVFNELYAIETDLRSD